jgi:hypothetical protein
MIARLLPVVAIRGIRDADKIASMRCEMGCEIFMQNSFFFLFTA